MAKTITSAQELFAAIERIRLEKLSNEIERAVEIVQENPDAVMDVVAKYASVVLNH